jgi:restriction system protein
MIMDFNKLRKDLQWLRSEDGAVPASQAITALARVLGPLLSSEGLELFAPERPDSGMDLIARTPKGADKPPTYLTIEYKRQPGSRPIGIDGARQFVERAGFTPYQKAMLIGHFGFTTEAREEARRIEPISVELLDLEGLEAWIRRLEIGRPPNAPRIQLLTRSISNEFALMVASGPKTLDNLKPGDFENMTARIMEAFGLKTTPALSGKDAGKDLIFVCGAISGKESYAVELRHWQPGKRIGRPLISDFMQVIIAEKRSAGLIPPTSGYATDTFQELTEIERQHLRFGNLRKVILLAQTYSRSCQGFWSPPTTPQEVLFEGTV